MTRPASLWRDRAGVALLEFSLTLPLLIFLFYAMTETAHFIIFQLKLDKAASSMADFSTQTLPGQDITKADLTTYEAAAAQIMQPFSFNDGTVIFTSVTDTDFPQSPCTSLKDVPCILWQQTYGAGEYHSQLGIRQGQKATIPNNVALTSTTGNVMFAEVFVDYQPIFSITASILPFLGPQPGYQVAASAPRAGGNGNAPQNTSAPK